MTTWSTKESAKGLWCKQLQAVKYSEIVSKAEDHLVSKLSSVEELFAGRHFDREVIILCVRWYLRYKLSFRDWSR